jgi:hypothetical protein
MRLRKQMEGFVSLAERGLKPECYSVYGLQGPAGPKLKYTRSAVLMRRAHEAHVHGGHMNVTWTLAGKDISQMPMAGVSLRANESSGEQGF